MAMTGFRNVGLKVLSIGLATLLWLIVAGEQLVERALRIPLELTPVPEHLEIVGGRRALVRRARALGGLPGHHCQGRNGPPDQQCQHRPAHVPPPAGEN